MRNFDAIVANLYPYNVDDLLIEKVCVDSGLDWLSDYTADDKVSVAKATIAILRNLVTLSSESNGGYSLSYDVDRLKERICSIAKANGLSDVAQEFNARPTVEFL